MNYKMWEKKADYIIKSNTYMRYIGVFALDGDLIAHAGAPAIQEVESARLLNFRIEQRQAKAVVNHMRDSRNSAAKINVAHLQFICFNHGTDNMIGMSNFNVDNSEKTIQELDKACFRVSHRHYTRSNSLQGHHLLSIAATLWKDVVIIGIGIPGEESCLSAVTNLTKDNIPPMPTAEGGRIKTRDKVRDNVMTKENTSNLSKSRSIKDSEHILNHSEKLVANPAASFCNKGSQDERITNKIKLKQDSKQDDFPEKSQITFRRTKSVDDVIDISDADGMNEDVDNERAKSATIRSIEALRNIGPFTQSKTYSDDDSKEFFRTKSTEMLIQKKEKRTKTSRSKSMSSGESGSKLNRRPSRATLV